MCQELCTESGTYKKAVIVTLASATEDPGHEFETCALNTADNSAVLCIS